MEPLTSLTPKLPCSPTTTLRPWAPLQTLVFHLQVRRDQCLLTHIFKYICPSVSNIKIIYPFCDLCYVKYTGIFVCFPKQTPAFPKKDSFPKIPTRILLFRVLTPPCSQETPICTCERTGLSCSPRCSRLGHSELSLLGVIVAHVLGEAAEPRSGTPLCSESLGKSLLLRKPQPGTWE